MVIDKVVGYIDFDGTLIKQHAHFDLHRLAAKNLEKWLSLAYYGSLLCIKDIMKKDNNNALIKLASILEGMPFDNTFTLIDKIELNNDLKKIKKIFPDGANLIILSRNDKDFILNIVNKLEKELFEKYKIVISDVIANSYEKKDGKYTGKIKIEVNNNKHEYFNGKYFFGDKQDAFRYKNYEKFVLI